MLARTGPLTLYNLQVGLEHDIIIITQYVTYQEKYVPFCPADLHLLPDI